jgi:hypothetical protein
MAHPQVQDASLGKRASAASKEAYLDKGADPLDVQEHGFDDASSGSIKEVFDVESFDPVLAKKMALVNEAIDEIGMTNFQWKMFSLNGFGYAVDSVSRIVDGPVFQSAFLYRC